MLKLVLVAGAVLRVDRRLLQQTLGDRDPHAGDMFGRHLKGEPDLFGFPEQELACLVMLLAALAAPPSARPRACLGRRFVDAGIDEQREEFLESLFVVGAVVGVDRGLHQ